MNLEGGCICGAIRYQVCGEPRVVTHCHCTHCRVAHAAPYVTWAEFDTADVAFTGDSPGRFSTRPKATRTFCTSCGTQLTFHDEDSPETVDLTVCSLDDPEALMPTDHVWCDRMVSWVRPGDGLPWFATRRDGGPVDPPHSDSAWPEALAVTQVRIARPTDRLEEVVTFYRDVLGLPEVGSFRGHAGYDGAMLGLPGTRYHLEFTRHEAGSSCPVPSLDNLLVLYVPDRDAFERTRARLRKAGHPEVAPHNPYWNEHGATFADPDGWRVVLMNTAGISL